jgi:hypothetical protein
LDCKEDEEVACAFRGWMRMARHHTMNFFLIHLKSKNKDAMHRVPTTLMYPMGKSTTKASPWKDLP